MSFIDHAKNFKSVEIEEDLDNFCENSLAMIQEGRG
jgi:hypothetical protein